MTFLTKIQIAELTKYSNKNIRNPKTQFRLHKYKKPNNSEIQIWLGKRKKNYFFFAKTLLQGVDLGGQFDRVVVMGGRFGGGGLGGCRFGLGVDLGLGIEISGWCWVIDLGWGLGFQHRVGVR